MILLLRIWLPVLIKNGPFFDQKWEFYDLTLHCPITYPKAKKRQYITLTRAILEGGRGGCKSTVWIDKNWVTHEAVGACSLPIGCFIKGFLFNPLFTICGSFILFPCCLSFCLTIFILNHLLKLATSYYSHRRPSWFHCYKIIRVSDKIGLR